MLQNNLKIAFRSLRKQGFTSLLNIFGLALGIAVALLLYIYVQDENNFDKFHTNFDNLYRVNLDANLGDEIQKWSNAPNIIAPKMAEEIADIDKSIRLFAHDFGNTAYVRVNEQNYIEDRLYWADKDLFELFSIDLKVGNPATALAEPNRVVISESIAKKYFGNKDPMGQELEVDSRQKLVITGILTDLPQNSTLDGEIFSSFSTLKWAHDRLSWSNASFETWLLLADHAEPKNIEEQIVKVYKKNVPEDGQWFDMYLQSFSDVHFGSVGIDQYSQRVGDPLQVRILGVLALVILLIACINYMNLATAQSQKRFKEVGISKTLGANRKQLMSRFFTETALVVSIAFLLAIILIALALPFFNQLAEKVFSLQHLAQTNILLAIAAIYFMVITLAGLYPAVYLSSFSPKRLLQTAFRKNDSAGQFRRFTVVTQFCASIVLIISTLVFYQQLQFIQKKNLGFQPEQVIALSVASIRENSKILSLKEQLRNINGIKEVCRAQSFPTASNESGYSLSKTTNSEEYLVVDANSISAECPNILNFNLLAGRGLPPNKNPEDSTIQVVINQYISDFMEWSANDAIGKSLPNLFGQRKTEVVGVVENFHFTTLHQPIGPYVLHNGNLNHQHYLLLQTETDQYQSLLSSIKSVYSSTVPSIAFDYKFVDANIQSLYHSEQKLARIILIFSILAILVACLGLFGLASFMAEQRTKEIGIRKILGASIESLVGLLTKEFLGLVLLALFIAIPIGGYFMNSWLEGFAYRTDVSWWVFVIAGLVALSIAFLTVSVQSLKAAISNPVESIRNE